MDLRTVVLYFIGVVTIIIGIISVVFNGLILFLFNRAFTNRRNRLLNANLISLTLSSLGLCFQFPFMVIACFSGGWRFGWQACELSAFTAGFFAYAQIYTLTCIALERAWATRNTRVQTPSTAQTIIKLSIVWTLSLILASLPYLGFGAFIVDGMNISCTFDYVTTTSSNIGYVITITCFGFLAPLTVIIFCYASMIRLVRMSNTEMRSHLRDSYSCKNQAALRMREYALAKTAGKSVIAFVIGWSPYACLALISLSGRQVPHMVQTLAALFAKSQTSLNAAVYVLSHPKFRKQMGYIATSNLQSDQLNNGRTGVKSFATSQPINSDTENASLKPPSIKKKSTPEEISRNQNENNSCKTYQKTMGINNNNSNCLESESLGNFNRSICRKSRKGSYKFNESNSYEKKKVVTSIL